MVRAPPVFGVNAMVLCSCSILDIERLGNRGWNWKNYQKYAQRVEQCVWYHPLRVLQKLRLMAQIH